MEQANTRWEDDGYAFPALTGEIPPRHVDWFPRHLCPIREIEDLTGDLGNSDGKLGWTAYPHIFIAVGIFRWWIVCHPLALVMQHFANEP